MKEVKAGRARSCSGVEIPLIDLRSQHRALQPRLFAALRQVFDSSVFVMGPNVRAFEEEMACFFEVKHAVGVASGTDALTLSLAAFGIQPGDEVLVPSFTYAATAAGVCHLGARPVFVDSLPDGFNLDPGDAERRITPRTRAIIPVHLYGEAAPMKEILELAEAHGLYVVEDVAQAAGGRWDGKLLGSLGHAGCFSFYPTKNLAGCGDGGMVITNDDTVAERVRLLRQQADASMVGGQKYVHPAVGYNSRLDELQAAVLRVKLPHLESWNRFRQKHARRYRARLRDSGLGLPARSRDGSHVYCLFTLRCAQRDELRQHLWECGVGTEIYYPLPLHLQEAYRDLGYREGDLPVSETLCKRALSIPVYPELTPEQVDSVADAILEFIHSRAEAKTEEAVGH
ncbi:MAG: DegT/DnrJ/EryC1/StrS family aminotransferase [Armatimonadota bacterium]|nr:MAG: DegT/DnrJ/EryC1/StrS family aminotransferase [Armatimonadota bacterium]